MTERKDSCELCQAQKLTTWHYEDEHIWIADCIICGVPMVVLKRHAAKPSEFEDELMERKLVEIADREVGPGKYNVDKWPRRIPDHIHYHARDMWW